jgi:hypothetical protein
VAEAVTQLPAPSQVGAARRAALVHSGVPQLVPLLASAHAPFPSQDPSRPQGVVSTAHLPWDPEPALMGRHNPLAAPVSTIAHELQVAAHAVSQQKFPTQLPPAHWPLPAQAAPLVSLAVQAPLRQ